GDSNFIPPDTMGAIGPNHIVELINGRFRVFDRSGNAIGGATSSLNTFWTNAGVATASSFDPRILYDSANDRWFAASADNGGLATSRFLVAVSNTNNPTGAWSGFTID